MLKTWITGTKDFTDQGLVPSEWVNDNVTIVDGGKLGKCMYFNGTSSRLSTTGYTLSNKWSWACWVKEDPSVTTWQCIIALNNNGSDGDMQTALWLKANEHRFEVNNNTKYNSTIQYTQGQWNHYAMSFDGTTTIVYLNGIQVATFTFSSILSRTNLTIGARSSNANGGHTSATDFLKGYINDLRIWDDHALSPMEVKELSKGLVLHYPLDNNGVGGENLAKGTNGAYSEGFYKRYTLSSVIPNGTKVTISCRIDADNVVLTGNKRIGLSIGIVKADGSGTQWFEAWIYERDLSNGSFHGRISNTSIVLGNMDSISAYIQTLSSGTVSISQVKVEIGDHPTPWCPNSSDTLYITLGYNDNIEYDTSGFGNNGTRVGEFSWNSDTPRYVASTHIGATTLKIHISNFPTSGFGNSYSFAWWGKNTTFSNKMFWGFSDGVRLNGMHSGNLWNTGDGAANPLYNIGTTTRVSVPSVNTWHHYVMTGNGTKNYVYLDGKLWAESKTYKSISGTSIYINGWSGNTDYCYDNMDISDFRIYATALSASDVLSLYQNSAYIDSQGNTYASSYVEG